MPFQRSVEYWTVRASGCRTNAAYTMRAGRTNSQPAHGLLRTRRQGDPPRAAADGLARRPGAGKPAAFMPPVGGMSHWRVPSRSRPGRPGGDLRRLLAADHLLELGRPALSEDRAGGVGDEVHRRHRPRRPCPAASVSFVTEPSGTPAAAGPAGPTGLEPATVDVDLAGGGVGPDPVEEEGGAIRVLRVGGDPERQRGPSSRARRPPRRAGTRRTRRCRAVGVVAGVLPVTVEGEDALALAEARVRVGVLDGVDVLGEVARLDPLLEMLAACQVGRRVDRRALLLEDPLVDRLVGPRRP